MDCEMNLECPKNPSRIFDSYRCLGLVSTDVPMMLRYIHTREEYFVISCTGRSFNTYASQSLYLKSVSPFVEEDISVMAADTYHVYTAVGNKVLAWRRGTELKHTYEGHKSQVYLLLPFAQNLVSIDRNGVLNFWKIIDEEIIWSTKFKSKDFKPTVIMHPATYINKVLIASEQGSMQLWNLRKGSLIHHFKGWGKPINCVVQAPAVNVVAIGTGRNVKIYDLKYSETLMDLECFSVPITAAFRSDDVPVLTVGTLDGSLLVWDLETKDLVSLVEKAHNGAVTGMQFYTKEPLLATSSPDNSIKLWIFDKPDGSCRLLNSRDGHRKPPSKIKFHGSNGMEILSTGSDISFRKFHIYNETYNRCMSRQKIQYRSNFIGTPSTSQQFPLIVDFTAESVSDCKTYEDLAACHENEVGLTTWSFNNAKQGNKVLILPKYAEKKCRIRAKCLHLTSCGQFVIGGYSDGTVERFNIQSGIHRKTYGAPAHDGEVCGVVSNQINSRVMTAGIDCKIKFWDFKTGTLCSEKTLSASVSFIFFHRMSQLVGVVLDDFDIQVVHIGTGHSLRTIGNVTSSITSACFSPDCGWITASSSDCLVRTWDLPTSSMVDVFRLKKMCNSVTYSPNGEYLAMVVNDCLGILLWSNKAVYQHIILMPLPEDYEPPFDDEQTEELPALLDEVKVEAEIEYESPEQLEEHLITMGTKPSSRWQSLLNIDVIMERSKPKQPTKTVVAPFILSSYSSTGGNPSVEETGKESSSSKILTLGKTLSPLGEALIELKNGTCDSTKICTFLDELPPNQVDTEIRTLNSFHNVDVDFLQLFIMFIDQLIETSKHYEASEVYLSIFLKVYGTTLQSNASYHEFLQSLLEKLNRRNAKIQEKLQSLLTYVNFMQEAY